MQSDLVSVEDAARVMGNRKRGALQQCTRAMACLFGVIGSVGLVGCVPHPPEPPVPYSLNMSDRGLQMIVCFSPETVQRLIVSTRDDSTQSIEWEGVLETSEATLMPLEKGDVVDLQRPIPSVIYVQEPNYSIQPGPLSIDVALAFEGGGIAYRGGVFSSDDFTSLSKSDYLYSDGTVHSAPREMDSADD